VAALKKTIVILSALLVLACVLGAQQAQQNQPPAAQQNQPPVAQQNQPPAAQQNQPPAAQQNQPPAAQQNQPPAAQQNQPPAAQQNQPPAAQQNQPPAKPPAEEKVPPDAAKKDNPVKPTPESLAKAKKTYAMDCAMCHGDNGDGKGDLAADMKNVTDFTAPDAMKNRTDGELFYIIRKGKGSMPPEGDRAKDNDVWNLVHYIRAFAKK
jgi:mono/diheme cytochrome c family protein